MIDALQKVYDFARENYIPIMDEECEQVLLEIMQQLQPKEILEIGTAVGYSASLMSLNSCDARIDTIEIDLQRVDIAKKLWASLGIKENINSIVGDIDIVLQNVVDDKMYDFVFLDGPKSRYLQHLQIVCDHVRSGGIVLADDVLFFGMVKGDEFVPHKHRTIVKNLRKFLSYLENNKQFSIKIIDKGNGIAIITKV